MKLKKNMRSFERWLRIYFGVVILGIYIWNPFPYSWWSFSGALIVLTGVLGYCPIYGLLGRTGPGMDVEPPVGEETR